MPLDDETRELLMSQADAFATFKEKLAERDASLAAMKKQLDDIERKANRSALTGLSGSGADGARAEERKALAHLARGEEREAKATLNQIGRDADGGFAVMPMTSGAILARVFDISPLGRLARRVQIGAGDAFEELLDLGEAGAVWVGERDTRPATDSATLNKLTVALNEICANVPVTQRLLDDAAMDLGTWVEGKIADKFARSEAAAFLKGDGILKPRGLITYETSTAKDGARPWQTIQHIPTGVSGGFPTGSIPGATAEDKLLDVVYSLRAPYRANARWLMNLSVAGQVRKFRDAEGRAIWGDAIAGQPPTLLGFPVELDEEMPDVAAGSHSIAFGDFQQAYCVIERPGLRMLRDPYSSKPNVTFYAYRRVGGALQNGEAVKLLKFSVS